MQDDEMPYIVEEHYSQAVCESDGSDVEYKGSAMRASSGPAFLVVLTFACEALIACAKQLDIMDEECGDGNYGSAVAQSASAIKTAIEEGRIPATRPFAALTQISQIIEREWSGLEGGIYALFLDTAAKSFLKFRSDEQPTANMWLTALTSANKMISEVDRILLGDRTLLDALIPAEYKLRDGLDAGLSPIDAFGEAVIAAESSAMQTVHMSRPCVGSTNLKTLKYPDPGAHAVGIWMRAAYEGVKLKLGSQCKVVQHHSNSTMQNTSNQHPSSEISTTPIAALSPYQNR